MKLDKRGLVSVKLQPEVKSISQVARIAGITRQAVEQADLTFGIILYEHKDDKGVKVVVVDLKYKDFIKRSVKPTDADRLGGM